MVNDNDAPQDAGSADIVEIDNIDFAVDDSATIDTDGNVTRFFDAEKNQVFLRKGSDEHTQYLADKEADDKAKGGKDADPAKTDDKTGDAGDGKDKETEGDDNESEEDNYYNQADYILKALGNETEEVEIDGQKVNIADLTEAQQLTIIVDEFDNAMDTLRAENEALKNNPQAVKFDNPAHQQIFDFLKKGGDVNELAKHILSNDPAARATIMSDTDVIKHGIKKQNPEYTPKDIEDEFTEMSDSMKLRKAKSFRAQMEKEGVDLTGLNKGQDERNAQAILKAQTEFATEAKTIKDAVLKMDKIAGIAVPDKVRQFLANEIVPSSFDKESRFVEEIRSNPAILAELKFLRQYAPDLFKRQYEAGLKAGLAQANQGTEKLGNKPLKTYSSGGSRGSEEAKVKTLDEVQDMSKWAESSEF